MVWHSGAQHTRGHRCLRQLAQDAVARIPGSPDVAVMGGILKIAVEVYASYFSWISSHGFCDAAAERAHHGNLDSYLPKMKASMVSNFRVQGSGLFGYRGFSHS